MNKKFRFPIFGLGGALLLFLAPAAALTGQEYPVSAIPDSLRAGADAVIREEVKRFEVRSPREGRLSFRQVVTLLNGDSDADELVVYYDAQSKVDKIRAAIYDAAGQLVRRIERDEIRDVSAVADYSIYDDNRVKFIDATYSHYPYTVVYEYEQDLAGISFAVFPDWYVPGYHYAVQSATFIVDVPSGFNFHYQTRQLAAEPDVRDDGRRRVHTWRLTGLPAVRREPYGPPSGQVLPLILTAPAQFQVDQYTGTMDSWEGFSSFVHRLYAGRDALPDAVAAEVRALTSVAATDAERIAILYAYLQRTVRYVSVQLGIGGWQPFDATYVATRKYGDCKALTNYMMALLRSVGIEAWPALIRSGEPWVEVREDFTSPRFNHVVLYLPAQDCWLECTSQDFPVNYLGQSNADRFALLVMPSGGRLIRTPPLRAGDNVETHAVDIELGADGAARIAVRQSSTGADHEFYRHMAGHYSEEERRKWLQTSSRLPAFSLEAMTVAARAGQPAAALDYRLSAPRYAAVAGKRMFVPINAIHPFDLVPEELPARRQPLVLRRGYLERDTFSFRLPDGYQVESAGPADLDSDFGRYTLRTETADGLLRVFRTLEWRGGRWPAERYSAFRTFCREVARADGQRLVLIQKRT